MTQAMDKSFSFFYEKRGFGPAVRVTPVPEKSIRKFQGKLPDTLLSYWAQYGWSGYGEGLLWIVDPDEYEPVLEAWIGDTPFMESDSYHVIARSAFGKLFLWGARTGRGLMIDCPYGTIFPKDESEYIVAGKANFLIETFFSGMQKQRLDFIDYLEKPLFKNAVAALGPLAADELYGFEPALSAGGKADLRHLKRLKAVEHLVLLAQLGERRVMTDIVKQARSQGLM